MELNGLSPQIVLLPGSPKTQGWHSCGQVSPLVPYGLSASSYLCPEIIPQWPLGKSKEGVVCSCVAPLSGFSGCSTRRSETSGV